MVATQREPARQVPSPSCWWKGSAKQQLRCVSVSTRRHRRSKQTILLKSHGNSDAGRRSARTHALSHAHRTSESKIRIRSHNSICFRSVVTVCFDFSLRFFSFPTYMAGFLLSSFFPSSLYCVWHLKGELCYPTRERYSTI